MKHGCKAAQAAIFPAMLLVPVQAMVKITGSSNINQHRNGRKCSNRLRAKVLTSATLTLSLTSSLSTNARVLLSNVPMALLSTSKV
jgi:hypothetical protein